MRTTSIFLALLALFLSRSTFAQTIGWNAKSALPEPTDAAMSVTCNNKIYVMGGYIYY